MLDKWDTRMMDRDERITSSRSLQLVLLRRAREHAISLMTLCAPRRTAGSHHGQDLIAGRLG